MTEATEILQLPLYCSSPVRVLGGEARTDPFAFGEFARLLSEELTRILWTEGTVRFCNDKIPVQVDKTNCSRRISHANFNGPLSLYSYGPPGPIPEVEEARILLDHPRRRDLTVRSHTAIP